MISRNSVWCSHSIGNSAFFLYPQWKTARFTWHLVLYPEVFASVMRLSSHSWNVSVLLPDKNKILKARSKKIKSFPSILTSQDKAQEYLQECFLSLLFSIVLKVVETKLSLFACDMLNCIISVALLTFAIVVPKQP